MPRNERLRKYRIQHNWRQQDLADQLQTSLATIQRWERGDNHPTAYYRIKLCALFDASLEQLGLLEETPAPEQVADSEVAHALVHTSAAVRLWTVPYVRNRHFTGRAALLDHLMQHLLPATLRGTSLPQPMALTGLGGIGKTQLAVEYAYRAYEQGHFTHTLWISAASEEALLSSFGALANLLPDFPARGETAQHKLVATIITWLEQCEQPWLLIFDNADTLSLLPPYLPHWGPGRILLTTRASAVGALATALEMSPMSVHEGTHFLLQRAQRLIEASQDEINDAATLASALGQFPLALDQAGAYIEETACRVHDYLQLYQQHQHTLLARRGSQGTGYPASVATTWSLSFEHVAQANPAAFELLRLCAFLSPDHIPEELLTQGAHYWPAVLRDAVTSRLDFDHLLQSLLAFSLVKRLTEDHLLSVHRLVQVVQRENMPSEEQHQWAECVVRAVNALFPPDPMNEVHTWPLCQRYLEQAEACSLLLKQQELLLPEAAALLHRMGIYLAARALYALAEPFFQRALAIREQQAGPEHLDVAETLNNLALLYSRQAKYSAAERLYQRALHIREQQLGPEHLAVAETLDNLALLYYQQGKYAPGEPLYQRALRIREQQLGPTHPDVAMSLSGLASLYYWLGKTIEAKQLYQRALHIWEEQLGPEHPFMAWPLYGLGLISTQQGAYEEAQRLEQQALHIWKEQLGPEHPNVAWVLHGLALISTQQGAYEEAEHLEQQALRIWEEQLGPQHPFVAWALHGQALISVQQAKDSQAEALFQQALHLSVAYLEPEHPETALILHDFAGFQQTQGKTTEALLFYQRALLMREHVLGAEHALTIETRQRLQTLMGPPAQRLHDTKL